MKVEVQFECYRCEKILKLMAEVSPDGLVRRPSLHSTEFTEQRGYGGEVEYWCEDCEGCGG